MPFKDILVHVDDGAACSQRLEIATRLATTYGAHLIGLHVGLPLHLPGAIAPDLGGEVARLHAQYRAQSSAAARAIFEHAVQLAGLSNEWRDVTGDIVDTMAMHARYADLAVIGQTDEDDGSLAGAHRLSDHLPLLAGTPVLVVPAVGHYPVVGEKVLVAWNAGREARRAVSDAMPILARARQVVVMVINPNEGAASHGEVPGADIGLHLARHGVTAVCETIQADDIDVGNMLLSRVSDEGVDLLVMGAYGRSRFREVILGGATRQILGQMTVPVFMSH